MGNPKKKILLVDDEPEFREIFSTELEAAGYDVKVVPSGVGAIIAAKEEPPDLVLMDVQMPGLNGVETEMQLRDDPETKNVKVVFLTNLGNPDSRSEAINTMASRGIKADGYIKKTEDMKKIVAEVGAYVG